MVSVIKIMRILRIIVFRPFLYKKKFICSQTANQKANCNCILRDSILCDYAKILFLIMISF